MATTYLDSKALLRLADANQIPPVLINAWHDRTGFHPINMIKEVKRRAWMQMLMLAGLAVTLCVLWTLVYFGPPVLRLTAGITTLVCIALIFVVVRYRTAESELFPEHALGFASAYSTFVGVVDLKPETLADFELASLRAFGKEERIQIASKIVDLESQIKANYRANTPDWQGNHGLWAQKNALDARLDDLSHAIVHLGLELGPREAIFAEARRRKALQ